MTTQRSALPTLTEVIDIEPAALAAVEPAALPPESVPLEALAAVPIDKGAALSIQVLETLRPRIDDLLEARLRIAMAPLLSSLADQVVQDLRAELAAAMQALVVQAVDDVLARRHKP